MSRGERASLKKSDVQKFLNQNHKLAEIRRKLMDPVLSKTHQANWSKNVFKRFETIKENYEESGKTEYTKLHDL